MHEERRAMDEDRASTKQAMIDGLRAMMNHEPSNDEKRAKNHNWSWQIIYTVISSSIFSIILFYVLYLNVYKC